MKVRLQDRFGRWVIAVGLTWAMAAGAGHAQAGVVTYSGDWGGPFGYRIFPKFDATVYDGDLMSVTFSYDIADSNELQIMNMSDDPTMTILGTVTLTNSLSMTFPGYNGPMVSKSQTSDFELSIGQEDSASLTTHLSDTVTLAPDPMFVFDSRGPDGFSYSSDTLGFSPESRPYFYASGLNGPVYLRYYNNDWDLYSGSWSVSYQFAEAPEPNTLRAGIVAILAGVVYGLKRRASGGRRSRSDHSNSEIETGRISANSSETPLKDQRVSI